MSEAKKVQVQENEQIKVQFDPNICQHAAKCVKGLPEVFNPEKRPWIAVNEASAQQIAEVIDRCPSGALTYELKGAKKAKAAEGGSVEVTVTPDGPLLISGKVVVRDGNGDVMMEASKMALCRCGHSVNKPFCDGSHKKKEWTA